MPIRSALDVVVKDAQRPRNTLRVGIVSFLSLLLL